MGRNPGAIMSLGLIVVITLIGLAAGRWIGTGNIRLFTLTLAFGGIAVFALIVLRSWQIGVFAFFVWILLEDLLRKYLGNDMVLYLAKDVLIVVIYAGFFIPRMLRWRRGNGGRSPLLLPIAIWFAWAVAEAFNPRVGHPLEPLLGLRMSFLYVPLIYLGYEFSRSERRVRTFLTMNVAAAAVIAGLGLVQAVAGLEFLNPGGVVPYLRLSLIRTMSGVAGSVPRPNSVFVEAGRFAQYLYAMLLLCLGLLAYRHLSWRRVGHTLSPGWIWTPLAVVAAGLYASGQRAALYLAVLLLPFMAYFAWRGRQRGRRLRRVPFLRIGAVLAAGLALLWSAFPEQFESTYAFYTRTLDPDREGFEIPYRVESLAWQFGYALNEHPLIGHGTGTNSLGRQYLYDVDDMYLSSGHRFGGVEMGFGAVVWEWGVIGLLIWLWWAGMLVRQAFSTTLRLKGTRFYWLGVTISYFLFSILFLWLFLGLQVYQNYVTAAFLWFLAGILLGLPRLVEGVGTEHAAQA
jgi:hypothetical protein